MASGLTIHSSRTRFAASAAVPCISTHLAFRFVAGRLNSGVRPCKSIGHPYNVQKIKFDWDPAKAASNLRKHGVSFEEAQSVFYDEFAIQFYDEPHSSVEERFLMLGMSSGAHLLLVCHCERDGGGVIRIISARKATKQESSFYEQ